EYNLTIAKALSIPFEKVKAAQMLMDEDNPEIFFKTNREKMRTLKLEKEAHFKWFSGIIERLDANVTANIDLVEDLCQKSMYGIDRYLYTDTIQCLLKIKEIGGKSYILSNGLPSRRQEIYKLGLEKYLDNIYISSEVGIEKPDFEAYRFVLRDLDISPYEAVFIDDQIGHVESASKIGIKSYRIMREKGQPSQWDIKSLNELPL
ncbi:MAG TPA: HAD family hydrolase, partial [Patescibacteria group bacterium]